MPIETNELTRRDLLTMIGKAAGGAAMYQAMSSLGHAAESSYHGPVQLAKAKPGSSVIILGAGLAGMVAAVELRNAGYKVEVLEFQSRAGGRCWTLRGGDRFTELDGTAQTVGFAKGNYFNPGPWRVPYHHHAMLDYYRRYGIKLEAFNQVNYNAYVHHSKAFGGKPQRFRHVQADVRGNVAELLAKAANQGALDTAVTKEDKEKLLASLKSWGVLDKDYRYVASTAVSDYRGYENDPAGGLMALAKPSQPIGLHELLQSNLWGQIGAGNVYEFHSTIFQPEGGMDMLAQAMARDLGQAIRYNAKVTKIEQGDRSVTVHYNDAQKPGATRRASADWCVCTIPASILAQLDIQVGDSMRAAIDSLPYGSSMKVGLEFKRRFWEEDERIYGGISYTDLPIQQISYPSTGYMGKGPAVLLGAYNFENTNSYRFSSLTPNERIRLVLEYGSQLHPQFKAEFLNGVSVAWHRMGWILGCYGKWTDELRGQHYKNLAQVDGRIVLAGEHVSYIPAWQEGAVLSSLDAIQRLSAKAMSL
ncbi:flavin monoamine oxidase family protein [Variovorax sp. J31P207]|uniref:flavin monoamine oxidase family protein n=1 Tax=Variovorax sp. J31P207 TaxID=3053510 RepID=UPI0025780C8C|nr:flavin monoamine oxidase family protein [Variovorax sp. J31P207]MDM0071562.1 flavin monoamine oxidase family protein [Variovorax sp. J31P207]